MPKLLAVALAVGMLGSQAPTVHSEPSVPEHGCPTSSGPTYRKLTPTPTPRAGAFATRPPPRSGAIASVSFAALPVQDHIGIVDRVFRGLVCSISAPQPISTILDPSFAGTPLYENAHYVEVTAAVLTDYKNAPGRTRTFRAMHRIDWTSTNGLPDINIDEEYLFFIYTDPSATSPGDWITGDHQYWIVDTSTTPTTAYQGLDISEEKVTRVEYSTLHECLTEPEQDEC